MNKCDLCKFCYIEPKKEIEYLKEEKIDRQIPMWYHCEITDMPIDNTHYLNCTSFKEKCDDK